MLTLRSATDLAPSMLCTMIQHRERSTLIRFTIFNIFISILTTLIAVVHLLPTSTTQMGRRYLVTRGYYKRGTVRLYRPDHGFEPYWPGGGWALQRDPPTPLPAALPSGVTSTRATTTPQPPTVCGEDCPQGFRHIREVCVRYSSKYSPNLDEFETLPSYCAYLARVDPGCLPRKYWGWVFVHVGSCAPSSLQQHVVRDGWRYTEDNHMRDVSARLKHFLHKFNDQNEWTRTYSGHPYNVTLFQNLEDF